MTNIQVELPSHIDGAVDVFMSIIGKIREINETPGPEADKFDVVYDLIVDSLIKAQRKCPGCISNDKIKYYKRLFRDCISINAIIQQMNASIRKGQEVIHRRKLL